MKILYLGDIVGRPGRDIIHLYLQELKKEEGIDAVVANAENSAGGSGITKKIAEDLFASGVDVITSGDHIWKKGEIYTFLDETDRVLRPLNYPSGAPGKGSTVVDIDGCGRLGVVNIIGRVFMEAVDCPFRAVREEVEKLRPETLVILVDIHAEATSEKVALGWYLDGLVSVVVGSHTHIPTADEKILPEGTAYLTDCGMTGPYDSVIGRRKENIIRRFITQLPTRFEMAEGGVEMHGLITDVDTSTGKALTVKRIQVKKDRRP